MTRKTPIAGYDFLDIGISNLFDATAVVKAARFRLERIVVTEPVRENIARDMWALKMVPSPFPGMAFFDNLTVRGVLIERH